MYKLFLSLRWFRSRPLNWIPVVCMMLGVMALLVILAIMDGFQEQLRATLRGSLSDVIVSVNYQSDFDRWEKILLEIDHIEAVSPHLQSFALVAQIPPEYAVSGEAGQMDGALVGGIDAGREAAVSEFADYLLVRRRSDPSTWRSSTPDPGRPFAVLDPRWEDKPGVILGSALAWRLRASAPRRVFAEDGAERFEYSRVYLTTMVRSESGSEERYQARQWDFCVTGIYDSGNHEIDEHVAFIDRGVAKEFFQLSVDPRQIRLKLDDYAHHGAVVAALDARKKEIYERTAIDPSDLDEGTYPFVYRVETWEDMRANFLNAIENEKGLIAIIAGMAFIVTGFMIFAILSMIVTMKTRDVGILKAIGATTRGVLRIFILNGLIVGVIGAGLGVGLGLLFIANINTVKDALNKAFGWEPFPQNIYLFSEIPTRVIPLEVAAVTTMALAVALIGAILPALKAARMDPVESLRYE